MPKEHQKRGRREVEKRKRQEEEQEHYRNPATSPKRLKPEMELDRDDVEIKLDDERPPRSDREMVDPDEPSPWPAQLSGGHGGADNPTAPPFYGTLDEGEQAYFKQADNILEVNQFPNDDERALFVANVYREAAGKELKVANSQSCSRFLERLIRMSTASQLKGLFQKLQGHFLHLFGHRFASHCCEALFLQSAAVVTQELIGHVQEKREAAGHSEPSVSMEDLFLDTIKELEGSLGYLMTDKFSSHVFRVLLVVLSGRPLATTTTSILQSKKKERVAISNLTPGLSEHIKVRRTVPSSFTKALTGMLSGTLVGLDTGYLRALASHPIGNPVLQLLLEIEFAGSGRQNTRDANSLFRRLIPDESAEDSAHFIKGILYDPVGSRLLETIIQHAPGKTFRALYQSLFRDSMGNLVRNDIAAFVVIKILERLGRDELSHAAEQIYGEIPTLIDRSRTAIAKTLIERSEVRQLDTRPVADALIASYGADGGQRLAHMLQFEDSDASGMANERKPQREAGNTNQLHGSLLVQAMLESPGRLREMVMSDLLEMDSTMLVRLSKDRTATHVIQKSLTCTDQDKPFRQKLIQKLHGHVADLASDAVSSHVVDAFWTATRDIRFIRERLAEELLENQWAIKETFPGRAVFRNWKMDLYRRRKLEWIKISAGSGDVGSAAAAKHVPNGRSGIELAREKFAASKTGIRRGVGRGSGGMAATARGSTAS